MLKLLKYEWKACARTCLPLYGVLILMSVISRILYVIPKNASLAFMLPAISSMLYMCVMVATFVVTAVILIQRFYKNLLGSEGYLMFTLPVTVSQHLLSKTIIAVVMMGLSGLAAMLSIGIFADMSFGVVFVDMIKGLAQNGGILLGLEMFALYRARHCRYGAVPLPVHCARPFSKPAPSDDVDCVVRRSLCRTAVPAASRDDGCGQCRAAAVRGLDESLV